MGNSDSILLDSTATGTITPHLVDSAAGISAKTWMSVEATDGIASSGPWHTEIVLNTMLGIDVHRL